MTFDQVRMSWDTLLLQAKGSPDRLPLSLDIREHLIVIPFPSASGITLDVMIGSITPSLIAHTAHCLKRYLHDGRQPNGRKISRLAAPYLPDEVASRNGLLLDCDWLIVWFTHRLLDNSHTVRAYLGGEGMPASERHSKAERVQFLAALCCLVCFCLRSISRPTLGQPTPTSPSTNIEFAAALLYLVAEYTHVDVQVTRRLAIEKHLRGLLGAETALYMTKMFYRDHTFHQIYVCLLGELLLQSSIGGEKVAAKLYQWMETPGTIADPAEQLMYVRRNWFVASLYHDVGYPLSLLADIGRLTEGLDSDRAKTLRKAIGDACDVGANAFADGAKVDFRLGDDVSVPALDHGVASAIHLRHLLKTTMQTQGERDLYEPAVRAVARHNLPESRFAMGASPRIPAGGLENEPLSFLLVLCDDVQEWGRVRVDPEQYREEVAANTQFQGSSPPDALRTLNYLVLDIDMTAMGPVCRHNALRIDLVYCDIERPEQNYLPIWLLRTRNLQRAIIGTDPAGTQLLQVVVASYWRHLNAKAACPSDLECLRNFVRFQHCWMLDEWIREAVVVRSPLEYVEPVNGGYGRFIVNISSLKGRQVLPGDPELAALSRWMSTYASRLMFATQLAAPPPAPAAS